MANLTFKSTGSTSVALNKKGSPNLIELQYSVDGGAWQDYTVGDQISLSNNQTVSFSGLNEKFSLTNSHYYYFSTEGEGTVAVSGEVVTLISGTAITYPYSFCNLFKGNTKITDASKMTLNSTTLTKWCYANMFKDCVNLSTGPVLIKATTLKDWCCAGMFAGCTSLTDPPVLSATTLATGCCQGMFYNCKNLTGVPALNAFKLKPLCYDSMFWGCEKMTNVTIGAGLIANGACANMFVHCKSLTGIAVLFGDWDSKANSGWDYTTDPVTSGHCNTTNIWTYDIPNTTNQNGQFRCFQELATNINTPSDLSSWQRGVDRIPSCWQIIYYPPLIFISSGSTQVALNKVGTPYSNKFVYTKNNQTTKQYTPGTVISLSDGDTLCFRGFNGHLGADEDNYYQFSTSGAGTLTLSGQLNSMVSYSRTWDNFVFRRLFAGCANIVNARALHLPNDRISENCYRAMFWNCTALTGAPALTNILTTAPSCCFGMFEDCTSLRYVGSYPGASDYYVQVGKLPASELADSCYRRMFKGCSTLVKTPVLCGTVLADSCYEAMFSGCINLDGVNYVNFTDWGTNNTQYTYNWLYGTSTDGRFMKPSALSTIRGPSNIPSGWTVQNK